MEFLFKCQNRNQYYPCCSCDSCDRHDFPQKLYVAASTEAEYAAYYERLYGLAGTIYYKLGFHDMYNSWWFITLVGMLGTSIIIASVDRVIPLYKSLKKQRTKRHPSFMKKQRIYGEGPLEDADAALIKAEEKLKELRYNVKIRRRSFACREKPFFKMGPVRQSLRTYHFLIWYSSARYTWILCR